MRHPCSCEIVPETAKEREHGGRIGLAEMTRTIQSSAVKLGCLVWAASTDIGEITRAAIAAGAVYTKGLSSGAVKARARVSAAWNNTTAPVLERDREAFVSSVASVAAASSPAVADFGGTQTTEIKGVNGDELDQVQLP